MSIESTVYRLLVDRQEYSPVDLLKAEGQLSDELYRAWRTGEIPSLDEAFEDVQRIRALLQSASSFVEALGLVAERVTYHGLDDYSENPLIASMDPHLNEALGYRHRPADSHQPDLFLDGGKTASINALCNALLARDANQAGDALQRASDLIPDYKYRGHAEKLISALATPAPEGPVHGFEVLERMERDWLPAAGEFLGGARGHIVLAPLWLDIGLALEPAGFDPEYPNRHASYAFEQARAWQRLKQAVLAVPAFRTHPVLLARLAGAESRLANRTEALEYWFAMCLLAPDEFSKLVESSKFEEPGVARGWQLAITEIDVDEELSAEWFPAWMLVHEPGLARALSDMAGESPPERAFNLVRALLLMPHEENVKVDPRSILLRRELQELHPGLLRSYLDRVTDSS